MILVPIVTPSWIPSSMTYFMDGPYNEPQPALWAAFLGLAGSLGICGMSFTGSPTHSALSTASQRWLGVAGLAPPYLWEHCCLTGGLGGVVVIDAAIGVHGRGSRLAHYFTVAATLDKSLTSHCL